MKYQIISKFYLCYFFVLFLLLNYSFSDAVCDLEIFVLELKQDLEDNGILDCLRIIKPPNGVIETIEQKNKRLAAQWDTSCAFESTVDWVGQLKKNYGITTLVDEIGEAVDHNIPEQADMCEIVRAAVAAGLFNPLTTDVTDIPFEALNYIDCPGEDGGSKICAANAISYYKRDMWTIMLDPEVIQLGDFPTFIKVVDNVPKYDVPQDAGTQIDRSAIESAMKLKAPSDIELQKLIASTKDLTKVDRRRPEDPWKRVTVRHSTFAPENISANSGWNAFQSTNLELKSNTDFFVIAYSMISGQKRNTRLSVRMNLDDVSQISSRMIQGYLDSPSITTAFLSKLQVGTHKITTEYRVSEKISLDKENKEEENIISGAIIIPRSDLFMMKVINPNEFQLFNDNNWADFPNLTIKVKLTRSSYGIVMYNLSMPGMKSHIVTRVDINTLPVFESRSIAGDSIYWGIHNAFGYRFLADVEYVIKVRYRTPYPSKSNPRMNDWESQSVMVLQLPDWVDYKAIMIDEEFTLNCENTWSVFPKMDIFLELEEDKSIIFIYNVVLPLVDKKMTVGIFLNNLLEKKSVLTYSSTMYFKALGYYPIAMTKGKYKIQLKYKTDACVSYKPQTDWENISFTVLDMN